MKKKILKMFFYKMTNFYPPFLGAGIRVSVAKNLKKINARLKLSFYNKNYLGTHYGGSLYSICDPFYLMLLVEHLGSNYIVWDKSARIDFKKPGKGTIHAKFHIPDQKYEEIRNVVDEKGKINQSFFIDLTDENGEIVASVEKIIHIRKKKQ